MDIVKKETPNKNFVKADTSEVYEDMSVPRARKIYKELKGVDIDSTAEWITNRCNKRYSKKSRKSEAPSGECIKVDENIVSRAIAGALAEMRFGDKEEMKTFPSDTISCEKVYNFILRKEVGVLDTWHILPDVKPYHPLQEFEVKQLDGEIEVERGSKQWKKMFAESYEGYEGYGGGWSNKAKEYADELGLDIDMKINDALEDDERRLPSEEKKKKREIFLYDLTS